MAAAPGRRRRYLEVEEINICSRRIPMAIGERALKCVRQMLPGAHLADSPVKRSFGRTLVSR
jgi:hypothetical protein